MSDSPSQDLRAQVIDTGAGSYGFPLGWARSALERFELSRAPGAPSWLVGAANVDGEVVPVVDLAHWLDPQAQLDSSGRDVRLLVGGQGESSLGLLFRGLPRLVRVAAAPAALADLPGPPALRPLCLGVSADDATLWVLDGHALHELLMEQI